MDKPTKFILLYVVLTLLAASVHANCKTKGACKALDGSCQSKDEECDGQAVKSKYLCKGKSCVCCFKIDQKECPTTTTDEKFPPEPSAKEPVQEKPGNYKDAFVKPVIGILAQELTSSMKKTDLKDYSSWIAASYVKWIESGGARVVPILTDQDDKYYDYMVEHLNGFMFPGGSASTHDYKSPFARTGRKLYERIVKAGEDGIKAKDDGKKIALWGTCLGFQLINQIECNPEPNTSHLKGNNVLVETGEATKYINFPLKLTDEWKESKLFKEAPMSIMSPLYHWKITHNIHAWSITPEKFESCGIGKNYNILSKNKDENKIEFISTIEHKKLPIYGAQWHIEKNAFEWYDWQNVPKYSEAIHQMNYFGRFFVDEARKNTNKISGEKLRDIVIYKYEALNMDAYRYPEEGKEQYKTQWKQAYFFKGTEHDELIKGLPE